MVTEIALVPDLTTIFWTLMNMAVLVTIVYVIFRATRPRQRK